MGLKVVALGGGTGLPVVLRGLKRTLAPEDSLTAIVSVTDDGGSSGRLRRAYNVLPMGDIRNCLVALSDNEPLMSQLFQYRYGGRGGLGGHALGNLILTALAKCCRSSLKAIETSGQVLAIRGRILPATLDNVILRARLADGRSVRGESRISKSTSPIVQVSTDPPWPDPAPGVLKAIKDADLIVLGPGSLFTSIIPHLLVRGVVRALARSGGARVLVGNLMTQPGETSGFSAADHLAAITRIAGPGLIDYYLAPSHPIGPALARRYAREGAIPVRTSPRAIEASGVRCVERDLDGEGPAAIKERHHPLKVRRDALKVGQHAVKVRHHEGKLARALLTIAHLHFGRKK